MVKVIVTWILLFSIMFTSVVGVVYAGDESIISSTVVNKIDQQAVSKSSYRAIFIGIMKQYIRDLILKFVTMKLTSLSRTDDSRAEKIAFFMGSAFIGSLVDYITKMILEHLATPFVGER